jgi:hypothetical protein
MKKRASSAPAPKAPRPSGLAAIREPLLAWYDLPFAVGRRGSAPFAAFDASFDE